jgi:hypothetical protein
MLRFSRDPLLKKEDDLDESYDDDDDDENGNDTVYSNDDYLDDILEGDDSDFHLQPNVLEIRIKSGTDVVVRIADPDHTATVLDLKEAAATAMKKQAQDHYIRLIRNGRMLAPDDAVLHELGVVTGDVIHAVMTTLTTTSSTVTGILGSAGSTTTIRNQPQGPQAALQSGTTAFQRRSFRGAGINAAGLAVRDANADGSAQDSEHDSDNEEDMDVEAANAAIANRLGFDRLRNSGMRRQEVLAMRSYFSRHVDRWIRQNQAAADAAAGVEPDPMRRRLMQEDAWMSAQGPASEFRLNLAGSWQARSLMMSNISTGMNDALWRTGAGTGVGTPGMNATAGMSSSIGTDRDFVWGFMLGFFVGFLMLVWVWMPTVPHKQKLGILTGISLQLALGMLKGGDRGDDDFVD